MVMSHGFIPLAIFADWTFLGNGTQSRYATQRRREVRKGPSYLRWGARALRYAKDTRSTQRPVLLEVERKAATLRKGDAGQESVLHRRGHASGAGPEWDIGVFGGGSD